MKAQPSKDFTLPIHESFSVSLTKKATHSVIKLGLPVPFKFDAFYFAPGEKLLIDFYPNYPSPKASLTYRSALNALARSDTSVAINLMRAALAQDPGFVKPLLHLGRIYFHQGNYKRARFSFAKAISNSETAQLATAYLDSLAVIASPRNLTPDKKFAVASDSSDMKTSNQQTKADSISQKPVVTRALKKNKKPQKIIVARHKLKVSLYSTLKDWFRKNTLVLSIAAVGAGASLVLGFFFWLLAMGPKKKKLTEHKNNQFSRIMELIEQNTLYHARKSFSSGDHRNPSSQKRIDLLDSDEALPYALENSPKAKTTARKPENAGSGYRARNANRNKLPDSERLSDRQRNPKRIYQKIEKVTFSSQLKRKIFHLALEGKSVREIARDLDIGVGEVELILGLDRTSSGVSAKSADDYRIDFTN